MLGVLSEKVDLRSVERLALDRMNSIGGWFGDDEARLMVYCAIRSLTEHSEGELVEVGSYLGRSTVVLATIAQAFDVIVHAIDPHQGDLGASISYRPGPTSARFMGNMRRAGVLDHINMIQMRAHEVQWDKPIRLLLIDAEHDYTSVRRDYDHFYPHLIHGAIVLFHDYGKDGVSGKWGVTDLVQELEHEDARRIDLEDSLMALEVMR